MRLSVAFGGQKGNFGASKIGVFMTEISITPLYVLYIIF